MIGHLRIEGDGLGGNGRVFYVTEKRNEQGEITTVETDLSDCVTGLTLRMKVGEVNLATLDVLAIGNSLPAVLDGINVRFVGPSRIGAWLWPARLLWRRAWYTNGRRPQRRRWIDITTFADRWRKYGWPR